MGPELWFILLLFVAVTIPVFIGAVAFINRATGKSTEDEIREIRQRIEELETKQG